MRVSERNIHDPVPKNASKFPIHQTYLTTDALGNSDGSYKFKCPEVWSSARSGKKSIAIRSIRWQGQALVLEFAIHFTVSSSAKTFLYRNTIPAHMSVTDVLVDIRQQFMQKFADDTHAAGYHLTTNLEGDKNKLTIGLRSGPSSDTEEQFRITDCSNSSKCSESLNIWLNQPKNYFPAAGTSIVYNNVWDRTTPLNFHASFVPFDNYQYLGAIFDNWNNPIIYQDANASPLFNIWITTDMKTRLNLLYEQFIFRFTFIIDVDDQYHS